MALGDAVDEQSGTKGKRRKPRKTRRRRVGRNFAIAGIAVVVLIVGVVGGVYFYATWRFDQIHKITVVGEGPKPIAGKPFNILMIGSDSRAGLTGLVARQSGAGTGGVAGQRSDSVKIVHVDPNAGTISIVSIPRDTMVTLLANQSLYGKYNRINVNFGKGPSLLAQTITANFGITINQTIVVSFAGLINAADALGGVYLDFRYPSWDPESGLRILHPGCQLVQGFQVLALSRSRHFYYNTSGAKVFPHLTDTYSQLVNLGWQYDGSSDFGRIIRQDAFLRAMVDGAKKLYNPLTLNSFLSALPQGISLDSNFSLRELVGLAVRFHSINTNAIQTWTLPNYAVNNVGTLGDVLFVQQPAAQQMLVNIFGSGLTAPADPPPNSALQSLPPPVVTTTTSTVSTTTTLASKKKSTTTTPTSTTTLNPTLAQPVFDPTPCTPS
ncbi:MAG TPA: LCP family protein [Acidimicrobiales bacterium]|nr:LCP family protein [Acidimicrobiales bacterium]